MKDFTYYIGSDGMITVMPNTPQAEAAWSEFLKGNAPKFLKEELSFLKKALKKAGYTVAKGKPPRVDDQELLDSLFA